MEGTMKVVYSVVCDNDFERVVTADDLMSDDKIVKAITSAFGGAARNINVRSLCKEVFVIKPKKEEFELEIPKDDFADALTLAEEDAKKNRRFKKACERIMLVDIRTID